MLRVTVREDFSYELASDLVADLKTVIEWLDHHFIYTGMPQRAAERLIPIWLHVEPASSVDCVNSALYRLQREAVGC